MENDKFAPMLLDVKRQDNRPYVQGRKILCAGLSTAQMLPEFGDHFHMESCDFLTMTDRKLWLVVDGDPLEDKVMACRCRVRGADGQRHSLEFFIADDAATVEPAILYNDQMHDISFDAEAEVYSVSLPAPADFDELAELGIEVGRALLNAYGASKGLVIADNWVSLYRNFKLGPPDGSVSGPNCRTIATCLRRLPKGDQHFSFINFVVQAETFQADFIAGSIYREQPA